MSIWDIFKNKKNTPKFEGKVLDYHEDEFLMVELIPSENAVYLKEDQDAIDDINENHSTSFGFDKIHILSEKKHKTFERKIKFERIVELIEESSLQKFDIVTTGYGSMQYESENTIAYGKKSSAIIIEIKNEFVEHIWFDLKPVSIEIDQKLILKPLILKISKQWDFILADWYQNLVIDSKIEIELDKYLNQE